MKAAFLISFVVGAAIAGGGMFASMGSAQASGWMGACAWDAQTDDIDCAVWSNLGIASVYATIDTPNGVQVVADEDFDCDSRVSVDQVSFGWQGGYSLNELEVELCSTFTPVDPVLLRTAEPEPDDDLREKQEAPEAQTSLMIMVTPRITK